jgi:hypothetical protein
VEVGGRVGFGVPVSALTSPLLVVVVVGSVVVSSVEVV